VLPWISSVTLTTVIMLGLGATAPTPPPKPVPLPAGLYVVRPSPRVAEFRDPRREGSRPRHDPLAEAARADPLVIAATQDPTPALPDHTPRTANRMWCSSSPRRRTVLVEIARKCIDGVEIGMKPGTGPTESYSFHNDLDPGGQTDGSGRLAEVGGRAWPGVGTRR